MTLDDLSSVKQGAQDILSKTDRINVVINNAGVMATPEGKTRDGFETQFGTNHIGKLDIGAVHIESSLLKSMLFRTGHFYLFQLLKNTLLKSATSEFPSRVVSVSSIGHRSGEVRFHDYNFDEAGSYNDWKAYGQAKTANIYFSNELERRYGARNLHSTSLHPGGIATGLQVHVADMMKQYEGNEEVNRYMKSPAQGAATSVYAALSEEWKHKGGRYLSNCAEQKPFASTGGALATNDDGYQTWAYDEEKEKRLWKDSLKMVGLEDDQ